MTDDEVSETEEQAFQIIAPMSRITLDQLPQSPKKTAVRAIEMGWEVREWLTIVEYEPTLFLAQSKEGDRNQHIVGDVRYEGYTASLYVVEARDPLSRDVGFRAYYAGKSYASGKKGAAGAFTQALIHDPVGIPILLHAEYKLIRPSRDKYETEASFNRRVKAVDDLVAEMDRTYNDGSWYFAKTHWFSVAGEFDAWLADWEGYTHA